MPRISHMSRPFGRTASVKEPQCHQLKPTCQNQGCLCFSHVQEGNGKFWPWLACSLGPWSLRVEDSTCVRLVPALGGEKPGGFEWETKGMSSILCGVHHL